MITDFSSEHGKNSLPILQKTHAEQASSMADERRHEGSGATAIPTMKRVHNQVYIGLDQVFPLPTAQTRKVGWRPVSAFHPNLYGYANHHSNFVISACYLDSEDPHSHPNRFLHRQKVNSFTQTSRCSSPLTFLMAEGTSGRARDFQPTHAKRLEGPCRPWSLRLKGLGRAGALSAGHTWGDLPSGHGRPGTVPVPGCTCSAWTAQGPPRLAPLDLLRSRP